MTDCPPPGAIGWDEYTDSGTLIRSVRFEPPEHRVCRQRTDEERRVLVSVDTLAAYRRARRAGFVSVRDILDHDPDDEED